MEMNVLQDKVFLDKLNRQKVKEQFAKVIVLDSKENPLTAIEGRISAGNISINGSSAVRRAGSLTFLAKKENNDLTNIDNLLSLNKRIKVMIGVKNTVDSKYPDIIWFKQGIFVISQPTLTHNAQGVNIQLQIKDKMCLLNGEQGGNLPTSVIFHEYDQITGLREIKYSGSINNAYPDEPNTWTVYKFIDADGAETFYTWDNYSGWTKITEAASAMSLVGQRVSHKQRIFDIIFTLVCNYGHQAASRIFINDVPLELKQSVRNTGSAEIYYNSSNDQYTLDAEQMVANPDVWRVFNYNEDCGYVYTDFVYPGELISSLKDSVCNILDKIKNTLGNYEYFFDLDGNFVFQEKKNYLNTSYEATQKLDQDGYLLDADNYYVNFNNYSDSTFNFEEGNPFVISYSNVPNFNNIKNDFHIWGKNQDGLAIHYHLVIKEKPKPPFNTWSVVPIKNSLGEYTGAVRLATDEDTEVIEYIPTDWRAELYLQGLQETKMQIRPDIYKQELLDLFDSIYEFVYEDELGVLHETGRFKADLINRPNDLIYWVDYINPAELLDISVESIGVKIQTEQKDGIKRLYNTDIPNVIMIDISSPDIEKAKLEAKCANSGQPFSKVEGNIYKSVAIGTAGYTAQETARNLIYQHTNFLSSVSIQSIPIYYLDTNTRITINDAAAGISGDYVINSINYSLGGNQMSLNASKALVRM